MADAPLPVTVVSDYVCPWCYIGDRRVAEFSALFEVDITWAPFELHPDIPPEGRHMDRVLGTGGRTGAESYREHLKAYAAEAGLELASQRIVINSHRALELSEFARDRGRFQEVHDALFATYWREGRNVGDMEVLCDIAATHGLDPDEFRREAELGRYAALVDQSTAEYRAKGVMSTPTMIFDDRFMLTGAQDLRVYSDILTRLGAKPRA